MPDALAVRGRQNRHYKELSRKGSVYTMIDFTGQDLTALLDAYGYWVILLLVTVESMGIPVPGESVLLAASIYAGTTHRLHVALVIGAAVAGAVLGDNLGFLVGREGGNRLLHRYGKYVRLDERKLRLGQYLFTRHGGKVVFFGRFIPVLRIWAAFLAGTHRMSWRRFLVFNAAGGAIWATVMGSGAYAFGDTAAHVGGAVGFALAAVATGLMAVVMVVLHRSEERLQRQMDVRGA